MSSEAASDWMLLAFDDYFDAIYSYLARRVGPDTAEDLAAEVFVIAFARQSTYESSQGSPIGWLFGIATNLIRSHRRQEDRQLRAYRRHGLLTDDTEVMFDVVVRNADQANDRQRLAQALHQLKPDYRDVLLLLAWTDLTYQQVAEALDIPIGTVRSRMSRAREVMSELLGANGQRSSGTITRSVKWTS